MKNIPWKLAVFDMAGTTVTDDHEVEAAFAAACRQSGLSHITDERIQALQGYSKKAVFNLLWKETLTDPAQIAQNTENSYQTFKSVLEAHYAQHPVHPTVGALECFAFLRSQGIKIALTTGFYRKVTDMLLEQLGWMRGLNDERIGTGADRIIDFSVSGEEVPQGRPAPDMIERAMAVLGCDDPAQVLNFGDTPVDIESGRNASCGKVIALTNGTHTEAQLAPHQPDLLLPSLADFPAIFESWQSNPNT